MDGDLRSRIHRVIAAAADISPGDVRDDMLLVDDLGIGSPIGRTKFLELCAQLELELGQKIPAEKLPTESKLSLFRVSDVLEFFERGSRGEQAREENMSAWLG